MTSPCTVHDAGPDRLVAGTMTRPRVERPGPPRVEQWQGLPGTARRDARWLGAQPQGSPKGLAQQARYDDALKSWPPHHPGAGPTGSRTSPPVPVAAARARWGVQEPAPTAAAA